MSFRKRKKKSKNNTHFKVSDINTNTNDNDDIIDTITNKSASISLSFQTQPNSARIQSTNNDKKKRKRRKMRIKASQRSFESDNNTTTHTNPATNIYNDEYLNSLKLENKSMTIPHHIQQTINNNKNNINNTIINISDTEIEMKDNTNNNDIIDISMEDDDIIQAQILTSKLQRRTKALSNAIDAYAKQSDANINTNTNININSNRKIYNKYSDKDPMEQFIALGKFKSTRDEIQQRLKEHDTLDMDMDMDNDNDDFEMQQMAKSGIKLKKKKRKHVIVIDDNKNDKYKKSTEWNVWNDNYDINRLQLEDVYEMIDNDINGKQNVVRPQSNYEKVEQEYYNIENKLRENNKECEIMEEKYEFFTKLHNESIGYLNCLSEKQIIINKYKKMDLYLRENRCHLLRMNYCFNEFELYHNAYYPNDFIKDINSANAYAKLNDLNDRIDEEKDNKNNENINAKDNESIFDFGNEELKIWNDKSQILNKKNYLLSKKKRYEYRHKYENKLELDCYSNENIENKYFIAREKLLNEMKNIFEDTIIKYRNFNGMCALIQEWKNKYKNEYNKAFVSISMAKLIAPFVRLELIEWNVLRCKVNIDINSDVEINILSKPKLFMKHKWYELIVNYGINENGEMNENDNDDLIVPTLVGTLVIKELINVIKFDWNIYNKIETKQLLLNINCAFEHINEYKEFNGKREEIIKCLYDKCDEMINDLIELKCINEMIMKILPNFKQLPNKPLDCLDRNSNQMHDENSNVPNGLMYKYIKRRIFNALILLECLCIVIVGVNGLMEYVNKKCEYVYKLVIEGFVTYLGRCPIRNAKNDNNMQMIIVDDLCKIIKRLFDIKNECKLMKEEEKDDDDDIQMNVKDKEFKLPEYIMKHIKRSVLEINNNINNAIRSNVNVTQNLSCLNKMCSC